MTDDIKLTATLDTSAVTNGVNDLNKSIGSIPAAATAASSSLTSQFANIGSKIGTSISSGVDFASKAFLGLNQGLELASKGIAALQGAIETIGGGDRLIALEDSFYSLQKAAGQDATQALEDLRKATLNTVSDFDLFTQANKAVVLGLPVAQLDELATAAVKLGRAVGRDAKGAFDDLVTGVGRGSALILDNLGIIVSAEDANERYAASIGKTADALTNQEKKLAFQTLAFEKINEASAKFEDIQVNAGLAAEQLTTSVTSLFEQFQVGLARNTELGQSLSLLNKEFESIDVKGLASDIGGALSTAISGVSLILPGVISNLSNIAQAIIYLGKVSSSVVSQISSFRDALFEILDPETANILNKAQIESSFNAIEFEAKKAAIAIKEVDSSVTETANSGSKLGVAATAFIEATKAAKKTESQVNVLSEIIGTTGEQLEKATPSAKKFAAEQKEIERTAKTAEAAQKKQQKAIEDTNKALVEANKQYFDFERSVLDSARSTEKYTLALEESKKEGGSAADAAKVLTSLYEQMRGKTYELTQAEGALNQAFLDVRDGADPKIIGERIQAVDELKRSIEEVGKVSADVGSGSFLDGILGEFFGDGGDVATGFGEETGAQFAQGMQSVLQDIGQNGFGRDTIQSLFGTGGAAIGFAVGGPIGAQIGQSLGDSFGESIKNVGKTSKDTISGAVNFLLPGSKLLGFDEKITEFVTNTFGLSDSAATQARKSADAFFADALDANRISVVIGGKLTEIKDLAFSGNQAGEGLFGTLPADTQAQFSALGLAIEQSLGLGSELGVGLGSVLANNLGGSLNNVQILLKQIGVSAEELKPQIEKAFIAGDTSATDALKSLQAVEQIAANGIPGAFGATDQAFQNLIDSTGRGAAQVDALGDIVAEAQDKGITSLDALKADLLSSGKFAAGEVDKLLGAVSGTIGESFLKLDEVSTETAIRIGAALESAGFAFTPVASTIQTLSDAIQAIPREKDITFNVRVNATSDDRNILSQATSGAFNPTSSGVA